MSVRELMEQLLGAGSWEDEVRFYWDDNGEVDTEKLAQAVDLEADSFAKKGEFSVYLRPEKEIP